MPKWRWTLNETFQTGRFSLTGQVRYLSSLDLDVTKTDLQLPAVRRIPGYALVNMGASLRVIDKPSQRLDFYVNVNNLLDKDPPFTGAGLGFGPPGPGNYTTQQWYDVVGRTYTVGLRFKY